MKAAVGHRNEYCIRILCYGLYLSCIRSFFCVKAYQGKEGAGCVAG